MALLFVIRYLPRLYVTHATHPVTTINIIETKTGLYFQAGETIVISSAAGQMGHLVGQIAKYLNIFLCKICCIPSISCQNAAFKQRFAFFNNVFFRILGLRVLAYTGNGDKASWIKTDLGFDWAFNYKTQDVKQTLNIAAPNGVIQSEILSD